MDDESFELEDGEVVGIAAAVNDPSSSAAADDDVQLRAQLDEATQVLSHQGQPNLARLARALVDLILRDAIWVLINDEVRGGGGGEFSGDPALFDESNPFQQLIHLVLQQRQLRDAMQVLNDETHDGGLAAYTLLALDVFRHHLNTALLVALRDDGNDEQQIFRDLRWLAIQALRQTRVFWSQRVQRLSSSTSQASFIDQAAAGRWNDDDSITECSICLVEFVDGAQVSVMPCPSRRGHKFHPDCITKWLEIRNTCPLCRHELPTAAAYDQ